MNKQNNTITKNKISPKFIVMTIIGIALLIALFFFDPSESSFYPPCIFLTLTGKYCAGCGCTRAIHALLHGHFYEALDHNALITLLMPILIYFLISDFRKRFFGKYLPLAKYKTAIFIIFAVITIAFWIMRNIPREPFIFLAP